MKFGYKCESGAIWLAIVAAAAIPFIPRKALSVYVPLWAVVSRLVARGPQNKARPTTDADPADAQKGTRFVMTRAMKLEERPVAIVTGTNSGCGYYTAVGLATEGYAVVITCRSAVLTQQTADRIREEAERRRRANPHKYTHVPEGVVVEGQLPLECDDFDSVHAFANWFIGKYGNRNVQVLVNNAGGMKRSLCFSRFHPELELHTAANFLGPLLLTELLLPTLEKHGGRVVYLSSEAHRFPQVVLESGALGAWKSGPDDGSPCRGMIKGRLLEALKQLNRGATGATGPLTVDTLGKAFVRYGTSKLLNTYHAHVIAQRYRNASPDKRVYACSVHPGCVSSNFSKDLLVYNVFNVLFQYAGLLFLKSWEEGAQTSLHCAMCPLDELELISPSDDKKDADQDPKAAVSPYFADCTNKTNSLLLAYGWDTLEAESIVNWGKQIVGLTK